MTIRKIKRGQSPRQVPILLDFMVSSYSYYLFSFMTKMLCLFFKATCTQFFQTLYLDLSRNISDPKFGCYQSCTRPHTKQYVTTVAWSSPQNKKIILYCKHHWQHTYGNDIIFVFTGKSVTYLLSEMIVISVGDFEDVV